MSESHLRHLLFSYMTFNKTFSHFVVSTSVKWINTIYLIGLLKGLNKVSHIKS